MLTIFKSNDLAIYATWAIAVGALAIAVSLIFGSEKSHHTIYPKAPFSVRSDRLWHSLAISGAIFTLIGSLTLGIKYSSQAFILIPIALVGYLVFHLAASWKLWQLYKAKSTDQNADKHNFIWCLIHPYVKVDEHQPRISITP